MRKISIVGITSALLSIGGVAQAAQYQVTVTNLTAGIHFTPLIVAAHSPSASMFQTGTEASTQMQSIAEGGDISGMAALLESIGASVATGDGLVAPGATVSFTIDSSDTNSVLSMTGMLLPTNDGFAGLNSVSLPSSPGQSVHFGARAYDAGTEGNDELVGSGAPGEAGFPAPPPLVATGLLGTGGTGINVAAEGFITPHRGVIGDLDPQGGFSDINAAIHRWADPVASVTITMMGDNNSGGDTGGDTGADAPSAVADLNGIVYSRTALEIFWQAASSNSAIVGYEVTRNGTVVESRDAQSFFDDGLTADTEYQYEVRAIDANGNAGPAQSVVLRTNGH